MDDKVERIVGAPSDASGCGIISGVRELSFYIEKRSVNESRKKAQEIAKKLRSLKDVMNVIVRQCPPDWR
jgi:hypothetical protein